MGIKLKDFKGSLDLFLHLASKCQMDIYDVPIVEVIKQYLTYTPTLQATKLEVVGEHTAMASQLMLVKSRKPLPKVVEAEPEENDPEQELLTRIEGYRRLKVASEGLSTRHNERAKFYLKPKQGLIFEDTTLAYDKTVVDLFLSFSHVMAEKQKELKNSNTIIGRDDYRIRDMMTIIVERLNATKKLVLTTVLHECQTLPEMTATFLATLELVKVHEVETEQKENSGDIVLRSAS